MTYLFNIENGEACLCQDEDVEALLESGEWADTPAKCGGNHTCEGPAIGEIAIEDYHGLAVEDFIEKFTKDELKVICKQLGVSTKGRSTEEQIAKALVEALTK